MACKDLTGNPGLPAGTPDPSIYNNATGALGMRNAAVLAFEQTIPTYIVASGLLTDELEDINTGASAGMLLSQQVVQDPLDERIFVTTSDVANYGALQQVRAFANQALGQLATYDTASTARDSAKVLRGELYAIEGYVEIWLADLFCSGVPLSTLDYQKDFTYAPSFTQAQVDSAAIAKFDTARIMAQGSDSVVNFANVGLGRAYIDLGLYTAAADDVATVPDGFLYQYVIPFNLITGCIVDDYVNCTATISDREGRNGLPFRSSGDPRTIALGVAINPITSDSIYFPAKYSTALNTGYAPFTVASGIEARLIEAEAALNTGNVVLWLNKLNHLRQSAAVPGMTTPAPSALPQLTDPADPTARIDTMFTERAMWLFLDGHRQGDLRRLLRQYGSNPAFSNQSEVYPTGAYLAPGTGFYGTDVTVPIPASEAPNPEFHGCLNRNP